MLDSITVNRPIARRARPRSLPHWRQLEAVRARTDHPSHPSRKFENRRAKSKSVAHHALWLPDPLRLPGTATQAVTAASRPQARAGTACQCQPESRSPESRAHQPVPKAYRKCCVKWQNEMFTFEIDPENALVGCTLERWRLPIFSLTRSVPISSDQQIELQLWYYYTLLYQCHNVI
jgi:hypothetical protein